MGAANDKLGDARIHALSELLAMLEVVVALICASVPALTHFFHNHVAAADSRRSSAESPAPGISLSRTRFSGSTTSHFSLPSFTRTLETVLSLFNPDRNRIIEISEMNTMGSNSKTSVDRHELPIPRRQIAEV